MSPSVEDDWSDSDEEVISEVETSVLLGVPDGSINTVADINDAAVSRIGGHPAFLPSTEPALSSSHCKICSNPMELLVQMWCPFEDSPMDRAMYIWGCARVGCQYKDGSIRAWRGLRYNEKYAAKLSKKRKVAQMKAAADADSKKTTYKPNPFSMQPESAPNPFSFGGASPPPISIFPTQEVQGDRDPSDTESNPSNSSEESLLIALASTSISESSWVSAPLYPPLYLSTTSEYLPPLPQARLPPGTQVQDPTEDSGKGGMDTSWAFEPYENSLEVDHVFERFTKRVGYEAEQCVRYELKGTPLPFASDKVFESLFPTPPSPPLPVTKPDFKVVHTPKRTYNTVAVPSCSLCGSKRVFECQLMPNLINIVKGNDAAKTKITDEERRKAVEKALKGDNAEEKGDMGWGTCMIFSCEKDCCVGDDGVSEMREAWREEVVLVQWDV